MIQSKIHEPKTLKKVSKQMLEEVCWKGVTGLLEFSKYNTHIGYGGIAIQAKESMLIRP